MKHAQVIRSIDELSRIVIPKDMRKQIGIGPGDPLLFEVDGNKITIQKVQNTCVFCGGKSSLTAFGGKYVCEACKAALTAPEKE